MDQNSQKIYLSSADYLIRLFLTGVLLPLMIYVVQNFPIEKLSVLLIPLFLIIFASILLPHLFLFHNWLNKIPIVEITNTGIIDRRILKKEIRWENIQRAYKRNTEYRVPRRLVVLSLKKDLSVDFWQPFIKTIYAIKRIRKEIEIDEYCLEIKRDEIFDMIKNKPQPNYSHGGLWERG